MATKGASGDYSESFAGFGEIINHENPNPRSENRFSTRRIVDSTCKTEEVEPGKFIRKCEKTEKILKNCVGRPEEVVEFRSEQTEDDVTDEVTRGSPALGSPGVGAFKFPGISDGLEALDQGLRDDFAAIERDFGQFINEAEGLAKGFLKSFGLLFHHGRGEGPPFGREDQHMGEQNECDTSKPTVADASKITEV